MASKYYHLHIEYEKNGQTQSVYEFDMSGSQQKALVDKINRDETFLCNGYRITASSLSYLKIYSTSQESYTYLMASNAPPSKRWDIIISCGSDVTDAILSNERRLQKTKNDYHPKRVFIVHGHDEKGKLELARMLQNDFKLEPIILADEVDKGRTLVEKFEQSVENIGFVFVLLTPDDRCQNGKRTSRVCARPNVILELGYFMGKLGRHRVFCLRKGKTEIPSDLHGIVYHPFRKSISERFREIAMELEEAGYAIRRSRLEKTGLF